MVPLVAKLLATGVVEVVVNGSHWLSSEVAAVATAQGWAATDCALVNASACAALTA